jgi:acyl-CoA dehydrogenase
MSAQAANGARAAAWSSGYDEAILALPFYGEEHLALAGRISAWCAGYDRLRCGPAQVAPGGPGRLILEQLGAAGLLAFLRPSGGRESGDMRSLCLAREGLAYTDDLADYAFSIQALSATPILRHGTPEQRARYLPDMAAGTLQGAFAVSELSAGSDVAAVSTTAEPADCGYVLRGTKAWIANAGTADVYCVIARTGEGPGAFGLTAFLVPATSPGLHVEPVPLMAPRAFGHVHLNECRVPADAVLGRPGRGFVIGMELLDRFRMTVGAAAVGFARRAADTALAHARSRPIYGAKLLDLATVQATLAETEVLLNASALLVARAAWECDRGGRHYAKHSSIAKLHATETAQQVIDSSLQILGAAGLVSGSVTERLYRQIRSLRIYEGASEIQKTIIARSLDLRRADRVTAEMRPGWSADEDARSCGA